ncbi:MAG: BON domain-containing protein [Thermoanaerobaculia bacterium]|nr:BON domain-containing protein [Thermoanaerobaculia bacterium]
MNWNRMLVISTLAVAMLLDPSVARATDGTPVAQELADAVQELAVRAKLVDRLGADALRISVDVADKTAVLSGTVSKREVRELAPDVALSVKGITIVRNEVELAEGPSTAEKAESELKDVALEIKVKSALLTEIGRNAMDINVEAADGVVVLRGTVSSDEVSELAAAKAGRVKGVRKVVNILGS